MKSLRNQQGMSLLGMLAIGIMVGFFVMCAIRMAPSYFEYLSVKEILSKVATDHEAKEKSVADLRRQIDTLFNTNQITGIQAKEVEVFRKEGKTYIDGNYEARVPVMGKIDAMLRFEDLNYTVGQPLP